MWRRAVLALAAVAFSVVTVLVLGMLDRDTVVDKADQQSVALGLPFVWIHQDQTIYDPPFPWQTRFSSPLENATRVSGGAFLANVLVVLAVVGVLGLMVVAVRRR